MVSFSRYTKNASWIVCYAIRNKVDLPISCCDLFCSPNHHDPTKLKPLSYINPLRSHFQFCRVIRGHPGVSVAQKILKIKMEAERGPRAKSPPHILLTYIIYLGDWFLCSFIDILFLRILIPKSLKSDR